MLYVTNSYLLTYSPVQCCNQLYSTTHASEAQITVGRDHFSKQCVSCTAP